MASSELQVDARDKARSGREGAQAGGKTKRTLPWDGNEGRGTAQWPWSEEGGCGVDGPRRTSPRPEAACGASRAAPGPVSPCSLPSGKELLGWGRGGSCSGTLTRQEVKMGQSGRGDSKRGGVRGQPGGRPGCREGQAGCWAVKPWEGGGDLSRMVTGVVAGHLLGVLRGPDHHQQQPFSGPPRTLLPTTAAGSPCPPRGVLPSQVPWAGTWGLWGRGPGPGDSASLAFQGEELPSPSPHEAKVGARPGHRAGRGP